MWIISTIECNVVDQNKQVEIIRYNIDPVTHMEIGEERRLPRNSAFERGYDEFLRNYHNDNGIERRGKYRVHESEENESGESSSSYSEEDGNDDDDDSDQSESVESEEKIPRLRSNPKNKPNKIKNTEQNANRKKTKHCKNVKRDNMLCSVCYNPRNDEKSESCSFSSDPKEDNYSYSEDSSKGYSSKSPESLEEDENSDEFDERRPQKKKKSQNIYPQQSPRFYSPFAQRPFQNYGPQTFLSQPFQPISRPGKRHPIRQNQLKNPPHNVAVVRYRTVETPFGNQRIRLISYPNRIQPTFPSQKYRKESSKYRHQDFEGQEIRPPRDINGAHSERLLSNSTKEHLTDDLPSHSNDETDQEYLGKYMTFMNKDWSKCKKLVDKKQICFECYVDGERRKECMFLNAHKPSSFYESYSASIKSHSNHPYAFEYPAASKMKYSKNLDEIKPHSIKLSEKKSEYSEQFNFNNKNNSSDKNNKQNLPQEQQIRSISDIIYGVAKPELII